MFDTIEQNHQDACNKAQERLNKLQADQAKAREEFQAKARKARKRHFRRLTVHTAVALAVSVGCGALISLFPALANLFRLLSGLNLVLYAYHAGIVTESMRWWSRG